MIMVQKQPSFSTTTQTSHRRHPSAPPAVVVVQPTRTPGLLSLSKPPRNTHSPQPHQRSHHRISKPSPVILSIPKHRVDIAENKVSSATPPTPTPAPRGRQSKDKAHSTTRTSSQSGRRHAQHRQQSPQQSTQTSQVEGPTTPTNSNPSDPFLDSTYAPRPQGKVARRRQPPTHFNFHTHMTFPKSSPVPVPQPQQLYTRTLSRSVPLPDHTHRQAPKRSSTTVLSAAPWDNFPICDDMTDAGDLSDQETDINLPSTPTRPTVKPSASKMAVSAPALFPSLTPPVAVSIPQRKRNSVTAVPATVSEPARYHRRTPSDGMFNMSSDEDGALSSAGEVERSRNELRALFGLRKTGCAVTLATPPKKATNRNSTGSGLMNGYTFPFPQPKDKQYSLHTPSSSPTRLFSHQPVSPRSAKQMSEREKAFEREAQQQVQGYFASSMFQNSPSPEELPDPLLV